MKIFVTGGTGFIGSHFIRQALLAGVEVVACRRTTSSKLRVDTSTQPHWIQGSLESIRSEDLEGCDTLVHFAAHSVLPPMDTIEKCIQHNVIEPLKLFRTAIKIGITRFIVAGSYFEYGLSSDRYDHIPCDAPLEPNSGYAASKASATAAFHALAFEENVEFIIFRIFQAYGEGESANRFWPSLRRAALAGNDFAMTQGDQIRDFIPVEMVADKFIDALTRNDLQRGRLLLENLGTGKAQSLADFAKNEWRRFGATGHLLLDSIPKRQSELRRCVALMPQFSRM